MGRPRQSLPEARALLARQLGRERHDSMVDRVLGLNLLGAGGLQIAVYGLRVDGLVTQPQERLAAKLLRLTDLRLHGRDLVPQDVSEGDGLVRRQTPRGDRHGTAEPWSLAVSRAQMSPEADDANEGAQDEQVEGERGEQQNVQGALAHQVPSRSSEGSRFRVALEETCAEVTVPLTIARSDS